MSEELPPLVYKYEDFTVRSIKNLKAQSIYFGSPKYFNDPYDCAIKADVAEPTNVQIEEIRSFYNHQPDLPRQAKKELGSMSTDQISEMIQRSARATAEDGVKRFLENSGVSCFSEINNDLLMWSHYGGRYKGFCLEFSTEFEPFEKLMKVNYVDSMPKIDPHKTIVHDNYDQYLDLYCTKSSSWSYEREWRALHKEAGIAFTYPSEALRGVYFGPDIDKESLEIICLIIQGQNPSVRFWRGQRSAEHFQVEFEGFAYTSYIEAK